MPDHNTNCIFKWDNFIRERAMVRNTRADQHFTISRPVVAVGNDYEKDFLLIRHQHKRAQLLYAAVGTMIVVTEQGSWLVTPGEAAWIAAELAHEVQMIGVVSTRSLYLAPGIFVDEAKEARVICVPALLRNLLFVAVDAPLEYDVNGRDGLVMQLLLHEISTSPTLPNGIPIPKNVRLAKLCRKFLNEMSPHDTIDSWSAALNMSRRTFTRLFKLETSMSFTVWRRQVFLFSALPRLLAGESVTRVAIELGYNSPGAFTTMFRRTFGVSPTRYVSQQYEENSAGHHIAIDIPPSTVSTCPFT
jgi:AraC-like DNA-binding protein/mannose-6-phosphate isomerase-like protein (cupin superfamily)